MAPKTGDEVRDRAMESIIRERRLGVKMDKLGLIRELLGESIIGEDAQPGLLTLYINTQG